MVRTATPSDAKAITDIYNYYILETISTFQEKPIAPEEIQSKIESLLPNYPWLVYEVDYEILGYAYVTPWKAREAYRNSIESSVYVASGHAGKNIGSHLYKELIKRVRKTNYHVIIGGISLPNDASISLHEKFGFEKVAHFKEIGYKFGKWIDVGYWQLILE